MPWAPSSITNVFFLSYVNAFIFLSYIHNAEFFSLGSQSRHGCCFIYVLICRPAVRLVSDGSQADGSVVSYDTDVVVGGGERRVHLLRRLGGSQCLCFAG